MSRQSRSQPPKDIPPTKLVDPEPVCVTPPAEVSRPPGKHRLHSIVMEHEKNDSLAVLDIDLNRCPQNSNVQHNDINNNTNGNAKKGKNNKNNINKTTNANKDQKNTNHHNNSSNNNENTIKHTDKNNNPQQNNHKNNNTQHKNNSKPNPKSQKPTNKAYSDDINSTSNTTAINTTKAVVETHDSGSNSTTSTCKYPIDLDRISRYFALILRHQPEAAGVTLDPEGWLSTTTLIDAVNKKFKSDVAFTMTELLSIVQNCAKQRYALSSDNTKIRANQGHSLKTVDLQLKPIDPIPETLQLYHGTASRFIKNISLAGLLPQSRQHVHLSHDLDTAIKVGSRHGKVVVLELDMESIRQDKCNIYCSQNGVYLMDIVPVKYIKYQENGKYLSSNGE